MFSLESPRRGDSNEYTQHTIFNINKEIHPKLCENFSKGLKNEFETAVVNEPSGFEPLKFYCIWKMDHVWNTCDLHSFLKYFCHTRTMGG